jgi:8-oxo-dGTP pyrophosphatase MutT (NUDIX family)
MLHPIDIINKNNQLTGEISDPENANLKGLWHRGVHVLVYTKDGHVLAQKRSTTMKRNPGKLDLSAGGFVDSGETPEQAAVREVKEETGLTIDASQLSLVNLTRYNHRWKDGSKQKISRAIIYTYLYKIDSTDIPLIAQRSEVAWLGFLPLRSVQWLVRRHSLASLGKLNGMYGYYAKLMRATAQAIQERSS